MPRGEQGRKVPNSIVCNQASWYSPTSSGLMGWVITCEKEERSPCDKDDCCESGQIEMKDADLKSNAVWICDILW